MLLKRHHLPALALLLACLGVISCGSSDKSTISLPRPTNAASHTPSTSTSTTATSTSTSAVADASTTPAKPVDKSDSDGDADKNDDDFHYGRAASPKDLRAITAIVKQYYAAAAAGDGPKGCALSYSLFAEEIPELYGAPSGPAGLRGKTCTQVMTKLFKQRHKELVAEQASLKVDAVRIHELRALAVLSFKTMGERDILVHREHSKWKIYELLDTKLG